jgi:O-antigen/teichoic acid export membrane protein
MTGLMARTAILTTSRLSNFAIQLLSPLLMVRILSVEDYGRYQEFMVYATMLTALSTFSIDNSLTYFIPKFPERERAFVTQTTLLILCVSSLGVLILLGGRELLLQVISFDFVMPLALYVFFFVNLNWLEYYWIAKRQARVVLYYSAARLAFRVLVLVGTAYLTGDVATVLWSVVLAEVVRAGAVLLYAVRRRLFTSEFRRSEVIEQLKFAGPIGTAVAVQSAGRSAGKLFIGSTLGPVALAYYAVGGYLQPVVRAVRSGIEDAVYPELVRAHNEPGGAVRLWQRVNVLNCLIFFPGFAVLAVCAEAIVTTLFTASYLPAVPVFIVYSLFLVRRCFNSDVLLRTSGRTGFVLLGTFGALGLNLALIAILSDRLGFVGPALAFIAAEVALEIYYLGQATRKLGLTVSVLVDWRSIWRVMLACTLSLPILIIGNRWVGHAFVVLGVAVPIYLGAVLVCAHYLGVKDVGRVARFIGSRIGGARKGA